ncbi:MAG: zf-HC2 domain-containing protein [Candidatus Saccharicenans sp.]|nr:zf-HC2 domain-containing protein [Candidatus Saccharicenans sp.]
MRCHDYQKWISDRLDGKLSQANQARLEEHLRSCDTCRHYYKDLKRIEDRVRQWPGAELTDRVAFEDKLRERISQEALKPGRGTEKSWISRLTPAWAVGLFLLAMALYLFFQLRPKVEPELDLAMLMSYEESYLALSQAIGGDEKWQDKYNDDLVNSIYEEVKTGEFVEIENLDIYQEQNIFDNLDNNFLTDNIEFSEGK